VQPQEYDDLLKSLVQIALRQDTINDNQQVFNRQLIEINQDIKSTLADIKTLLAGMLR
jgi:hypothetical protein